MITTRKVRLVCQKCAPLKKSGKYSCCAPGGAWFNKCGNAGNKDVRHSWLEGIRACDGFGVSSSGNEQSQLMLNHDAMRDVSHTTHERNDTQKIVVSLDGGGGGRSMTGSKNCEYLHDPTQTIPWLSFSFIMLKIY